MEVKFNLTASLGPSPLGLKCRKEIWSIHTKGLEMECGVVFPPETRATLPLPPLLIHQDPKGNYKNKIISVRCLISL